MEMSLSTSLNRADATSRISNSLSIFSYSTSTNFAMSRMRGGVSEARLVKRLTKIPRRCSSSSKEDVAPSFLRFASPCESSQHESEWYGSPCP